MAQTLQHGVASIACATCGFLHVNNPVAVVAALVETNEGIILARAKNWPPKMFGLVTGYIEPGERPEDAVLREVKEELGLRATVDQFIGVFEFAAMNQVLICYHLTAAGDVTLNDELEEVKIIAREELKGWDFGTGVAVSAWLRSNGQRPQDTFPINTLLEQLGRRWALRILWELSRHGPLSFNGLREACGNLSPDTLSTRLKDLRDFSLLEQSETTNPQLWKLTEKAQTMKPHLLSLARLAAEPH